MTPKFKVAVMINIIILLLMFVVSLSTSNWKFTGIAAVVVFLNLMVNYQRFQKGSRKISN
ncbi:hypothetical protein [Staphylococcus simiae]|uniref:Uncharacterized protein n=1 Tax=Staphylococcus simiae CCM 7213 = CCUG 51256 TaxID=911238 RepID=G5JGM1_9STAP|nr:hypothetical protein [Staphylococcus simiae]EHJ08673.1 hypothetical protein SS7213T_02948 [Staphylococcus simiae CCM 7213 = CCUG 51256]PNZ11465.1 hypothetical protein CD113_08320 [Staphylococcus simiae]SNV65535.1 Uncharacterised protein [Staphylococcus simiae]